MLGFLPTRAYRPGTPGATTFLSPYQEPSTTVGTASQGGIGCRILPRSPLRPRGRIRGKAKSGGASRSELDNRQMWSTTARRPRHSRSIGTSGLTFGGGCHHLATKTVTVAAFPSASRSCLLGHATDRGHFLPPGQEHQCEVAVDIVTQVAFAIYPRHLGTPSVPKECPGARLLASAGPSEAKTRELQAKE